MPETFIPAISIGELFVSSATLSGYLSGVIVGALTSDPSTMMGSASDTWLRQSADVVPAPLASAPADRTPASAAAVVKTTARLRIMSPPPAGWARPGSRKEPGPGRCYEVSRLGQRAARRELLEGDLDALGIPR